MSAIGTSDVSPLAGSAGAQDCARREVHLPFLVAIAAFAAKSASADFTEEALADPRSRLGRKLCHSRTRG